MLVITYVSLHTTLALIVSLTERGSEADRQRILEEGGKGAHL